MGRGSCCEATYDDVLSSYSTWLELGPREVVDVHTAMRREVTVRRRTEPTFTLAKDGVHPDATGHWLIARELLGHCGLQGVRAIPTCEQFLRDAKAGPELRRLGGERQQVLRDAWLSALGHKRPGLRQGLPLPQAQARAAELAAAAQRQLASGRTDSK